MADKDYQFIANKNRIPSDDEIKGIIENSYSKILVDIKTQSYIACFTENLYSSLMWAHYADSYKGFAVEYKAIDLFPEVLPVQYSPERIDATDLVFYCLAYKLSTEYHIHSELKDMLLPTKILTKKQWIGNMKRNGEYLNKILLNWILKRNIRVAIKLY